VATIHRVLPGEKPFAAEARIAVPSEASHSNLGRLGPERGEVVRGPWVDDEVGAARESTSGPRRMSGKLCPLA
jgi:hypothetical protein